MKIGILGGGQLGRMLAAAATPLGLPSVCIDPSEAPPAAAYAQVIHGDYDDPQGLKRLVEQAAIITYEFENVSLGSAADLARQRPVLPPPKALEVSQDRLTEKDFIRALGIGTAEYRAIACAADIAQAVDAVGLPAILKTRRFGYDGKGQVMLKPGYCPEQAWREVGEVPCIVEACVPFDRELSVIAVRSGDPQQRPRFYPLAENHHRDGILRLSISPATDDVVLQAQGESIARRIMDELDYVGVMAVELFHVGEDLIVNEIAPRVHNSGHWTIEASQTSQFENHIRAVAGLPLGSTASRQPAAMVNLIGAAPPTEAVLGVEGASLHLYGKEPRHGRKIGHVTVCGASLDDVRATAARIQAMLPDAG